MIGKDKIRQLIPHAGSMCLLDGVESWDAENIVCVSRSHLDASNPLQFRGHIPAVCLVEYAAQAMAVHGGLSNVDASGVGYLASIRNLVLADTSLDSYDTPLKIYAQKIAGDERSIMYQFHVTTDNNEIASGRAAVVLRPPGVAS